MRTNITKSKAGHYTVVIRDKKRVVFKQNLISSLWLARKIAKEEKEKAMMMKLRLAVAMASAAPNDRRG